MSVTAAWFVPVSLQSRQITAIDVENLAGDVGGGLYSSNLADYFLVRKGEYVIADFFRRQGRYGAFQWRTIAVYVFGIAVQVPFMSLSFLKGMVAPAIAADLAWLPGLAVPAVLYVIVARRLRHYV
jgi:cytosine/uracil/thiamine/allantoin permease